MVRDTVRQSRRHYLKVTAAGGLGLGLAGCTDLGGGGGGAGTINIGFIGSLSGPYTAIGEDSRGGADLAVEMLNGDDGINGQEVSLIAKDSQVQPDVGLAKARELITQDNVDAIVGIISSGVMEAIQPLATRNEVPIFGATPAATKITGESCTKYTFRVHANVPAFTIGTIEYMNSIGTESVAILAADYSFGRSMANRLSSRAEENGITVASNVLHPFGTSDFSSYISQSDTDADVLFMANGGTDTINALNELQSRGLQGEITPMGVGAIVTSDVVEGAGSAINGAVGVSYYPQELIGSLNTEYNAEYQEEYERVNGRRPNRAGTAAYESTHAFAEAAANVGYEGPDDMDDLIGELEGFEMDASVRYPQGNKYFRAADHQAILRMYVARMENQQQLIASEINNSRLEEMEVTCPDGPWVSADEN